MPRLHSKAIKWVLAGNILLSLTFFQFSTWNVFRRTMRIELSDREESPVSRLVVSHNATENTRVTQKPYTDNALLPLLPWEILSMENRTCEPPKGTPQRCCLGSVSSGGSVKFHPNICNVTRPYIRAQTMAQDFLRRHPVKEGEQKCDVCQILDYLIDNNWNMTFQGDSLTRQTFRGLECEFLRRGFVLDIKETKWNRTEGLFWRLGIQTVTDVRVTRPSGTSGTKIGTGRIKFYNMYRPLKDNSEMGIVLDEADIVVFDHGLHWHPGQKEAFREDMATLLSSFRNRTNLKLVAWRETSAQHYNTTGGHFYQSNNKDFLQQKCVPIPIGERQDFRLRLMQNATVSAGMELANVLDSNFAAKPIPTEPGRELLLIPFRDFSTELYDLHPGECSHYCHTPHLWLPLWRSLRIAMDRIASSS